VRLDGAHRLSTLFLLQGIYRAAPAQVTACRVVTPVLEGGKYIRFNSGDIYIKIVGNKKDYTWINKCNLKGKEEEEKEP